MADGGGGQHGLFWTHWYVAKEWLMLLTAAAINTLMQGLTVPARSEECSGDGWASLFEV
ncbi:hypothetical protein GCM10027217_03000 [Pseudomaricurvus hydrocarbonicus]